ncbi:FGGY family carbohydrate kinase [Variovorax sp. J22R133]|uniref:FGGY-family carbohydrate kinase n=1 Tax=Variovorax brevis TaxID=3053503 RepID=UPI0025750FE1|nr:FGGY family carbohydrate kinase [Variovorax sp. J22R133]MDM0113654.1 FGGY family carbohydrate kinase [Variovorax sp. J22R133]
MSSLLLGIDVGTFSSKAALVTPAGEVLRTAVVPHGISTPAPGHVEQDADAVWWHDLCSLCMQLLDGSPWRGSDVAGVAVSAIGPCLLPLDEAGRPLRPGILYGVDVRATDEIGELDALIGRDGILRFSLMSHTSQAIGPKIRWLRKHEPDVWQRTHRLTTASAYLTWRLTGEHRIDRHTASHFMPLYDPATGQWDSRHAEHVAPVWMLPSPGWSDEVAGTVTHAAAQATGLAAGTPVAVGAVDALSEAISVGVVRPGDLMIMYGSTTFFILVQSAPTPDERVWTVAGAWPGQFNLAAGMGTTGSLTRWFQDQLARDLPEGDAHALFDAAARVAPGAGGLVFLPYFSGERTPLNDPLARGLMAGLSLAHTRDQMFRAILEGVACGVRHNVETLADLGAHVGRVVAVGGGAQTDTWLQIVSDVSGLRQEVPTVTVGACYGDAFLAGCAAGLLQRDQIDEWVRPGRVIEPAAALRPGYDALYRDYLDLYLDSRRVVHRLATRQSKR